jgi:hypothetical protein
MRAVAKIPVLPVLLKSTDDGLVGDRRIMEGGEPPIERIEHDG